MRVLVTGATGFIGRPLCAKLLDNFGGVRAAIRNERVSSAPAVVEVAPIDSIGPRTDWGEALSGIDVVIHLAARAHVMRERAKNPLEVYRSINVLGTERLAKMAAAKGVKRLVYISSVKVNGEGISRPYTEEDNPAPSDPYGVSKLEAERILARIGQETGMEIAVIRAPLVYGPGVRANFYRLMSLVASGLPLPFEGICNARSLIYLGNLIEAINLCAIHPQAGGKTFLVSDGEDVSTPELIRRLAKAMDRPAHLFPVPVKIIRAMGKLSGKSDFVARMIGSLTLDSSKIRRELGWTPSFGMREGLRVTADWYQG